MRELLASGDPVLISALRHHLEADNIAFDVFDGFVSSLFPGEMNIASARIMVADEDYAKAKRLLESLQNGEMAI